MTDKPVKHQEKWSGEGGGGLETSLSLLCDCVNCKKPWGNVTEWNYSRDTIVTEKCCSKRIIKWSKWDLVMGGKHDIGAWKEWKFICRTTQKTAMIKVGPIDKWNLLENKVVFKKTLIIGKTRTDSSDRNVICALLVLMK